MSQLNVVSSQQNVVSSKLDVVSSQLDVVCFQLDVVSSAFSSSSRRLKALNSALVIGVLASSGSDTIFMESNADAKLTVDRGLRAQYGRYLDHSLDDRWT